MQSTMGAEVAVVAVVAEEVVVAVEAVVDVMAFVAVVAEVAEEGEEDTNLMIHPRPTGKLKIKIIRLRIGKLYLMSRRVVSAIFVQP